MCHAICKGWPAAWATTPGPEEKMRLYFDKFSKWAFLDSLRELPGVLSYARCGGRCVVILLWTLLLILGVAVSLVIVATGEDDHNLVVNIALIFVQAMNFNE